MLLEKAGIDNTVVLKFDDALSRMEACDFVEKILAGRLGMKYLVVGFNHRFGRGGSSEFNEISDCARRVGFGVERFGSLDTGSGVISSTIIREALGAGDLVLANDMLGYDYFLRGSIVEGRKMGRSIGFPTANISTDYAYKLLPADGVYIVRVQFNGSILHGMANIGHRPTVNITGEPRSVEVHIFGFSESIYGQSVTLSFIHRLRDEMKFESVDALRQQLIADRLAATEYLHLK
jgi:riboflavin kinase/FMN adenylyltransferase